MTENKRCYICGEKIGIDYYLIESNYMCHDCGKEMVKHLSGEIRMTENKRFYKGTIDFLDGEGEQWAVFDKEQKRKTTTGFVDECIVDNESETCIDNMIHLLNNLNNENEQLKKVIDEADDLIKSHLTNHYKRKWKNICEYYGVDIE